MTFAARKPKRKPEKLMLRVVRDGFQPADGYTQERLEAKGFKAGEMSGINYRSALCRINKGKNWMPAPPPKGAEQ